MYVQRLVGGNRPRRRGPDHGVDALVRQLRQPERRSELAALVVAQRKRDIDCEIDPVLIFDLRFSQRRAAVEAPINRLQATKDEALGHDLRECAQFIGFVLEIHRLVRPIPQTEHAETLEVALLPLDLLRGVRARARLHLSRWQIPAVLFLDQNFDRHAVAVPPRHVLGVEARHLPALDDEVLQRLVQRLAHVDVVVGVRRPVVQDPLRATDRCRADLTVNVLLVPFAHPLGLALGKITAHRKR